MLNPSHKKSRDWTVLYYGGGVNNLDQDIQEAWTGLQEDKLPSNVDTFVRHIDQQGHSQDIHIGPDGKSAVVASSLNRVDSSDPKTLADFVRTGVETYPAKHYLVVISSHGRGAEGAVEDDLEDAIMRPHELKAALEAGKQANDGRPLDAVLFDACRMAAIEVASELSGSAFVSIASLDSIANSGYDLAVVLNAASASENAFELGERLVGNTEAQQLDALNSISAVDLSRIPKLRTSWKNFTREINQVDDKGLDALALHALHSRRNRSSPMAEYGNDLLADSILSEPNGNNASSLKLWIENEAPGDAVAILSFCNRILGDKSLVERYPDLGDAAVGVITNHDDAVYAYRAQDVHEDPGGLTVLLPLKNEIGPLYDSPLSFAESTQWETAYNAVLPDGDEFQTEKSWLERELEKSGVPRQERKI
jgi:Clostripain family